MDTLFWIEARLFSSSAEEKLTRLKDVCRLFPVNASISLQATAQKSLLVRGPCPDCIEGAQFFPGKNLEPDDFLSSRPA